MHGNTGTSKAAPALWLKHFSAQCNPPCKDKCVHMDQGGKLFDNPEVKNLFTKLGHAIHLTGADASDQNGPAERGHRTIADAMRAFLTGADLSPKFWPHAFCHSPRVQNTIPTPHSNSISPVTIVTGKREDFHNLRTFRCRVWV